MPRAPVGGEEGTRKAYTVQLEVVLLLAHAGGGGILGVEDGVRGHGHAALLEHTVRRATVEEDLLLVQVVEHHGLAQRRVRLGLLQRETSGEEGDEDLATRPLLDGRVQDRLFVEEDRLELSLAQTVRV